MAITKLGVLGAGTMGSGIAQVGLQGGLEVTLVDLEQSFIDRGLENIIKNFDKSISKGRITEKKNNF